MIDRYARPEMKEIWSDEGRYRRWLEVELAVCEVTPPGWPRSRPRCATT
jgi:adenylosuccinate lyase